MSEVDRKIRTDRDFVNLKRFEYSLKNTLQAYPEGAPDEVIARALNMTVEEVEEVYQGCVVKLRAGMKIDEAD